jgi:amino acid transporter
MGSRLLYGMSHQGLMPSFLKNLHPKRLTPHRAIIILLIILIALALLGDISQLARATSVLLLGCFVIVNGALLVLKKKDNMKGAFEVPAFVPIVGILVCLAMLSQGKSEEFIVAGGIIAVIVALYFILKPSAEAISEMDL